MNVKLLTKELDEMRRVLELVNIGSGNLYHSCVDNAKEKKDSNEGLQHGQKKIKIQLHMRGSQVIDVEASGEEEDDKEKSSTGVIDAESHFLVEGEQVLKQENDVCLFQWAQDDHQVSLGLRGTLWVTNFRLAIVSERSSQRFVCLASVALCCIEDAWFHPPMHVRMKCSDVRNPTLCFSSQGSAASVVAYVRIRCGPSVGYKECFGRTALSSQMLPRRPQASKLIRYEEGYGAMGIGGPTQWDGFAFRWTQCNEQYEVCETYPRKLLVLAEADDECVKKVARYRSRGRLPVLSWVKMEGAAGANRRVQMCIMRCSQPGASVTRKRSTQDERMMQMLGRVVKKKNGAGQEGEEEEEGSVVIVDARPKSNAVANQARGGGREVMSGYPGCRLVHCGVANIHVVRKDYTRLVEATRGAEADWYGAVEGWLRHVGKLLEGGQIVADGAQETGAVLLHCSDGWDRTAQLTCLAQALLDGHARTVEGFLQMLEREWVSFGHRFRTRTGVGLGLGEDGIPGKEDERCPVMLQWLDCMHQMCSQRPSYFQYDQRLLLATADALHSAQYATFLGDCDKERQPEETSWLSFYDHVLSNMDTLHYVNPTYDLSTKPEIIKVSSSFKRLRVWQEWFLRYVPE